MQEGSSNSTALTALDIQKLKQGGSHTVGGLLMRQNPLKLIFLTKFRTRKELLNIKGISDTKLDKILEAAAKLKESYSFSSLKAAVL